MGWNKFTDNFGSDLKFLIFLIVFDKPNFDGAFIKINPSYFSLVNITIHFFQEFKNPLSGKGHGVDLASRLLAVKIPDYIVCLDSIKETQLVGIIERQNVLQSQLGKCCLQGHGFGLVK